MVDFLTLDTLNLTGKTVLLRADLNVPLQNGVVTDDSRLSRLLPTLRDLAHAKARIVILSHFGRPKGQADTKNSLRPVAQALEKLWQQPIGFAKSCVGPEATAAVQNLVPGQILVLENTRFYPGEEANDPLFVKELAQLGDVYINDAFSCAHRAHASTEGLAHVLPAGAGRLMHEELLALTQALTTPERPLVALIGGSKISTKLELLYNLINKVDFLVLGGGMANTFLAAQGVFIGKSLAEPDMYETARSIMTKANNHHCHILLPKDVIVATALQSHIETETVNIDTIPANKMILDVGPLSVCDIQNTIAKCKTLVWNGPLGAFEFPPFDTATNNVARYVADLTKKDSLLSVAGGGDTVAAMANAGVLNGMSYLSTAGGAFLEWLEGKDLPGVVALHQAALTSLEHIA